MDHTVRRNWDFYFGLGLLEAFEQVSWLRIRDEYKDIDMVINLKKQSID